MPTCVAVFGPPGSGKTSLCRQFVEQHSHAVMLSIGEAVRANEKLENRETPSLVAERALETACKNLPHGHFLVLDGLKRASHVLSSLEVFSRHGMQLKTAIQLTDVRAEAGTRGRLDDDALPLRLERYEADKSQLLSTFKAASVKVVKPQQGAAGRTALVDWILVNGIVVDRIPVAAVELEGLAELTAACAMPEQCIDWKACGGKLPQLDMPIQVTNVNQLDWISFPGRYSVGVKADGERAFLVAQNGRLWLSFRSGVEREWNLSATLDVTVSDGTVLDGEFLAESNQFIAFDLLRLPARSLERDPLDSRLDELNALGLPHVHAHAHAHVPADAVHTCVGVEEQFSRLHVHAPSPSSLEANLLHNKAPLSVKLAKPLDATTLKLALESDAIPSDGLIFSARELPCGWGKTFKWQPADQIRADLGVAVKVLDYGQQFTVQFSFSTDQPTTNITFPSIVSGSEVCLVLLTRP